MFFSRPKTISFEDARRVLVMLLTETGCQKWAERLAKLPAPAFDSILGGMGSFSDLIICPENRDKVTEAKTPLANELLNCLRAICYAGKLRKLSAAEALEACGGRALILPGSRCLGCGYAETGPRQVRSILAAVAVRDALRAGIARREPAEALIALWHGPEDTQAIDALVQKITASGIHYSERKEWMRPCPSCQSEDTAAYRWRDDGTRFVPTDDNLPLRAASPPKN